MSSPSDWSVYIWIVVGILVSVAMPVVRNLAGVARDSGEKFGHYMTRVWPGKVRPYFFLAIFSFLTALVILAGVRVKKLEIDSTWGAFLLGYFADATIQKLRD